jgi:hypothetical protein
MPRGIAFRERTGDVEVRKSQSAQSPFPQIRRIPNQRDEILAIAKQLKNGALRGGAWKLPKGVLAGSGGMGGGVAGSWVAAPKAGVSSCLMLPITVEAHDIANLRDVCTISLGDCRYFNKVDPLNGVLTATLPSDFEPTSKHEDFLQVAFPDWAEKMDRLGWDRVWNAATKTLNRASFVSRTEWKQKGLYWSANSHREGFFFRAYRYAVALLYSYADQVTVVSKFSSACHINEKKIRDTFDGGVYKIGVEKHANFADNIITVDSFGGVQGSRTWDGRLAISVFNTAINDSWQVTAGLADYYFWWAIRLYDYVVGGHTTSDDDRVRFTIMSLLCAKAALSEIADLAHNILHEFSHTTGIPATWYECSGFFQKLECCHFYLQWIWLHVVYGMNSLPLSLLAGGAETLTKPETANFFKRNPFDFDIGETWRFSHKFVSDKQAQECSDARLSVTHNGLWVGSDSIEVDWEYPRACADRSEVGSQKIQT